MTDEAGEISNFVAVNTDITERKRQQVIDRINDGVIEVDADWRCTLVSDEAEELVLNTLFIKLANCPLRKIPDGYDIWTGVQDGRRVSASTEKPFVRSGLDYR